MPTPPPPRPRGNPKLDPELYARLRAEAKAPYRGLLQFIYVAFGLSGWIGALIFASQWFTGKATAETLPNLALQLGVVALMAGLYRWEQRHNRDGNP